MCIQNTCIYKFLYIHSMAIEPATKIKAGWTVTNEALGYNFYVFGFFSQ